MRMKELWREPEVIFWVFIFPLLLALGLGIAFRDKPPDVTTIAIVDGAKAQQLVGLLDRSPQHASIHADVVSQPAALDGFRLGKYALVVSMDDAGIHYRYDPARPESLLARTQVDDALQTAADRKNPINTTSTAASEPGARYIDFLIPGLLGMNLMNSGMWGIGFAVVEMRQRKLLKRFVATPMRRSDFLLALASSRLVLMIIEVGLLLVFGILVFHLRVEGSLLVHPAGWGAGCGVVWRDRLADCQPGAEDRERQWTDQRSDDADVDLLRCFLLLRAFSQNGSSGDPGAAADRAQRCFAGDHSAGRAVEFAAGPHRGAGGMGWTVVRSGFALVPLELGNPRDALRKPPPGR